MPAGYQIWSRSPDSTFPFEICAIFLASQSFKGQAHPKILQSKKIPISLIRKSGRIIYIPEKIHHLSKILPQSCK